MSKIESIYSLKEIKTLLENHSDKNKIIVYFDIDLTLVYNNENNIEKLIEPNETKELFDYIINNNILFSFITARFYDTACNKRKRNLKLMQKDIDESIFPMLETLGIDLTFHKSKELEDKIHIIKNKRGICVGIIYRGVFFSAKKGETIKYYHEEFGIDKTHPHIIFIDDLEEHLKGVIRHIPGAKALKRKIGYFS